MYFIASDSIPAFFDIWLLGDAFLTDAFGTYQTMRQESTTGNEKVSFYMEENFNVKEFHQAKKDGETVSIRVINALTQAINKKDA